MIECKTKITRPSCTQCALKHLSQAWVIFNESHKGYEEFYWLCMGHMAEAEDELAVDHPEQALKIRFHRTNYQTDDSYKVPFGAMISSLSKYEKNLAAEQLKERHYDA